MDNTFLIEKGENCSSSIFHSLKPHLEFINLLNIGSEMTVNLQLPSIEKLKSQIKRLNI